LAQRGFGERPTFVHDGVYDFICIGENLMADLEDIYTPTDVPANVAAFMSGTGSNVRRLLEMEQELTESETGSPFHVSVIVTDNPDPTECNARQIAAEYGELPVVELDIRKFYADRGCKRVSLKTDAGFEIREEWTSELWRLLQPFEPNIGALGGFEPLTNIVGKIPCINVHPGDLSVLVEGRPYLVGLHTIPIKRAIRSGRKELRTSTILATPYGREIEMDEGPVLMISEPLPIELPSNVTAEELGGQDRADELERIAKEHQNRLKEAGDWVVFPLTVKLVAEGRFGLGEEGTIYFDGEPTERGVKLPHPDI